MKIKITNTDEIINGEDVTVWRIDKGNGTILINLNRLLQYKIINCEWLDKEELFLRVDYIGNDRLKLIALVNTEGEILRKEIFCIDYLEHCRLFIVVMSGEAIGEETQGLMLSDFDRKFGVINEDGWFVIEPSYDSLRYEEKEGVFYANDAEGNTYKLSIDGNSLVELQN